MQRKKLLKSMCEKAKKKISLAKNINNCYIVNYKIVLMEFLGNMKKMYKENKAITIFGSTGAIIKSIISANSKQDIDLPAGLYLVKIGEKTTKVIVN